jgi:hypothetical protein
MRIWKACFTYLLIFSLLGCSTLGGIRARNRENLRKLELGMSKIEVLTVMGTKTKTCYDPDYLLLIPFTLGLALPWALAEATRVTNPYKTETLESKTAHGRFNVLYYYTDMEEQDGVISDDELTPLVLENGKLIGWGWSFLDEKVPRYKKPLEEAKQKSSR